MLTRYALVHLCVFSANIMRKIEMHTLKMLLKFDTVLISSPQSVQRGNIGQRNKASVVTQDPVRTSFAFETFFNLNEDVRFGCSILRLQLVCTTSLSCECKVTFLIGPKKVGGALFDCLFNCLF